MDPNTIFRNSFIHLKIDKNKVNKKDANLNQSFKVNVFDCQYKPTDSHMTINCQKKLLETKNNSILLLGSNQGNRVLNLSNALILLENSGIHVLRKSRYYKSKAWGFESSHLFINQAIEVSTLSNPIDLLQRIQQIEDAMGRERKMEGRYEDRIIDIDIILYGNAMVQLPNLIIPHPEMTGRQFVLKPICELIPQTKHPLLKKTMQQLLEECPDEGKVSVFLEDEEHII